LFSLAKFNDVRLVFFDPALSLRGVVVATGFPVGDFSLRYLVILALEIAVDDFVHGYPPIRGQLKVLLNKSL